MIVDSFKHDEGVVEIHLEERTENQQEYFVVLPRWQGGGLVNGYEYRVDKITRLDAKMVADLDPIKELTSTARHDVESRAWERYQKALRQLEQAS